MTTLKTVPALARHLAEMTGFPDSTLVHIARRLREAEHLSQTGRGRGAALASSRDAATILLVTVMTGVALYAGTVAKALADSKIEAEGSGWKKGDDQTTVAGLKLKSTDPVGVVAEIIDALRERNTDFGGIDAISIWPGSLPVILWDDGKRSFQFNAGKSKDTKKYLEISGRRGIRGIRSRVEIEPWVLTEIANWLEGRETK